MWGAHKWTKLAWFLGNDKTNSNLFPAQSRCRWHLISRRHERSLSSPGGEHPSSLNRDLLTQTKRDQHRPTAIYDSQFSRPEERVNRRHSGNKKNYEWMFWWSLLHREDRRRYHEDRKPNWGVRSLEEVAHGRKCNGLAEGRFQKDLMWCMVRSKMQEGEEGQEEQSSQTLRGSIIENVSSYRPYMVIRGNKYAIGS